MLRGGRPSTLSFARTRGQLLSESCMRCRSSSFLAVINTPPP